MTHDLSGLAEYKMPICVQHRQAHEKNGIVCTMPLNIHRGAPLMRGVRREEALLEDPMLSRENDHAMSSLLRFCDTTLLLIGHMLYNRRRPC